MGGPIKPIQERWTDLNYVGLRPPCVILGWAPETAQPKITFKVGLRPRADPELGARAQQIITFGIFHEVLGGPYLASPGNLLLRELVDISLGAI